MKITVRWFTTGLVVAVLVAAWGSMPADAHGGEGESNPVSQVEQALAIVVNTPDAASEALERSKDALAEETEEPVATGPGDSDMEAQQPEEHGLTIRVEGGFVAPNTSDLVALGVALLLAAGGIAFVLGRGAARDNRNR